MSIYDNSTALAKKLMAKFKNPSQLIFEQQTKVSDGMGGYTHSWATKFVCDGAVIPLNSAEQLTAMQLQDESTHKAYIEVSSGTPTTNDRLQFKGVTYNITGVLNIAEADAMYTVFLKSGVVT